MRADDGAMRARCIGAIEQRRSQAGKIMIEGDWAGAASVVLCGRYGWFRPFKMEWWVLAI
jgi:hypothetical protein